jgi:hypothetical protein
MVRIETIAEAILNGDSVIVRSLVQDFLHERTSFTDVPRPAVEDVYVLAVSASLLELFASRLHQRAPSWTQEIGPVPQPVFLLKSAKTMKRLRTLCETASPAPLRKRGLYAPPNYLEFF